MNGDGPDPRRPQLTMPEPFDGWEYAVTLDSGRVVEGCHVMPASNGKYIIFVVPTVNGEGGELVGHILDRRIVTYERTRIHKPSWAVSSRKGDER